MPLPVSELLGDVDCCSGAEFRRQALIGENYSVHSVSHVTVFGSMAFTLTHSIQRFGSKQRERLVAFALSVRAQPLGFGISRPPMRSLSLQPNDSLTTQKMALSIGFIRFVSSANAIQAAGS